MRQKIFCVQHILPSVVSMLDAVSREFSSHDCTVSGKRYSTIPRVLDQIRNRAGLSFGYAESLKSVLKLEPNTSLLTLDEGGILHDILSARTGMPPIHAAGVEQTTQGLRLRWAYPTVLVCRSAAKLLFESQIIARGIIRKLGSLGLLDGRPIGLVGVGALGSELALNLTDMGLPVKLYDKLRPQGRLGKLYVPIEFLLASSDLIIGATGKDCLAAVDLSALQNNATLVSCSSGDVEFRSILQRIEAPATFEIVSGLIGHSTFRILNGGFPINFDRDQEWETPEEMWLTRQLCLAGLRQAEGLIGGEPRGVMLDPAVQCKLVQQWLEIVPDVGSLKVPSLLDEGYFRARSEGEMLMTKTPHYELHSTTPGALGQMRTHSKPYETVVSGLPITVLPNVWSPQYDWSSAFYLENFPSVEGRSFLEVGSGTGVISVYAGLNGASQIIAVDLNPDAVENTRINFEKHQIRNAKAYLSDGFNSVNGSFDVITWNAPYHGNRPNDALELGCSDENYSAIRAFFNEVSCHLTIGGTVVFGFSESGDLTLIRELMSAAGFRVQREFSDWRQEYNCMLFHLVSKDHGASPVRR